MNLHNQIETKSPLKELPPRYPGQGLDAKFVDLIMMRVAMPIAFISGMVSLILIGWLHVFLRPSVSSMVILTAFAAIVLVCAAWWIRGAISQCQLLVKGAAAERTVGAILERLGERGYRAVHDIVRCDRRATYNIDHVLVGPAGIFVIETKYRSKPKRGEHKMRHEGDTITFPGDRHETTPSAQVDACINDVKTVLRQRLGVDGWPIRGIVCYPGWYVIEDERAEVPVLNPVRLGSFLSSIERTTPNLLSAFDRDRIVRALYDEQCAPDSVDR